MKIFRKFILISCYFIKFSTSFADALDYHYKKHIADNHVIHVVTISPKNYEITIIKSNDGVIGRETVPSMAKRSRAKIAINAGFFEIGQHRDGIASGTLIIDGKIYSIKNQIQPLVILDSQKFSIEVLNPKNYIITSPNSSMVSGIPMLISNGIINQDILGKKSGFYLKPHARTAIGTRADGTIVIVVVEHVYQRDLLSITMGEVNSLMQEKGDLFSRKYNKNPRDITLNELKEILEEEYVSKNGPHGISLLKLAQFMKKLRCVFAINLDGGGSSTLWLGDRVINQTIGDADEGNGVEVVRGVSDAIVFKQKSKVKD
jgi:exopolysaccharide biosynthesis protein